MNNIDDQDPKKKKKSNKSLLLFNKKKTRIQILSNNKNEFAMNFIWRTSN